MTDWWQGFVWGMLAIITPSTIWFLVLVGAASDKHTEDDFWERGKGE